MKRNTAHPHGFGSEQTAVSSQSKMNQTTEGTCMFANKPHQGTVHQMEKGGVELKLDPNLLPIPFMVFPSSKPSDTLST